jgi:2-haloacid dehalogenase
VSDARWVTFDCFGTLVDWRHGIATCADLVLPGHGAELLALYAKHEAVVQQQSPTARYRDVLTETLRRAAAEAGLRLDADDASVLATGIPHWPVFPDTRQALAALKDAGWHLALLTNCDRDIIGETQRRIGVPIDAVVTSEDVGSYKPNPNHFTHFRDSFAPARGNWVHVAQSYFHDLRPAYDLGIPTVWVNRQGDEDDPSIAHAVVHDLKDLARTVELCGWPRSDHAAGRRYPTRLGHRHRCAALPGHDHAGEIEPAGRWGDVQTLAGGELEDFGSGHRAARCDPTDLTLLEHVLLVVQDWDVRAVEAGERERAAEYGQSRQYQRAYQGQQDRRDEGSGRHGLLG